MKVLPSMRLTSSLTTPLHHSGKVTLTVPTSDKQPLKLTITPENRNKRGHLGLKLGKGKVCNLIEPDTSANMAETAFFTQPNMRYKNVAALVKRFLDLIHNRVWGHMLSKKEVDRLSPYLEAIKQSGGQLEFCIEGMPREKEIKNQIELIVYTPAQKNQVTDKFRKQKASTRKLW